MPSRPILGATANDEPAGVDAAGELVYYPARSWSPFSGAMWALLSAFGSTLSSANMLQIRIYLGLQGTAFNPGPAAGCRVPPTPRAGPAPCARPR